MTNRGTDVEIIETATNILVTTAQKKSKQKRRAKYMKHIIKKLVIK